MRALLELGETQLFGEVDGAAFAHAEAALGVVIGKPSAKTMIEFTLACGQPPELLAHAPVELAGYAWAPLRLMNSAANPAAQGEGAHFVRLTPERWSRVPPQLSEVLATVLERRAIFCDERLVSFAWAPWRSAGWFDLHVETLPEFRRKGLARGVVSAVIDFERTEGRAPVWSAADEVTLAFGAALGFVDCGQRLWRARMKGS